MDPTSFREVRTSGTFCIPVKEGESLKSSRSSLQEFSLRKTAFLPITLDNLASNEYVFFLYGNSFSLKALWFMAAWGAGRIKERIGKEGPISVRVTHVKHQLLPNPAILTIYCI